MATNAKDQIREELSKIKDFRKTATEKLTAESLKVYKGFEKMSLEMRQHFLETMRGLCQIALTQLNRLNNKKNG